MPVDEHTQGQDSGLGEDFEYAAGTQQNEEERKMPRNYMYVVDSPFHNHRLYTEADISNADIDRLLRPILEAHGIRMSEYDPYSLSFQAGEKTVRLSVADYESDPVFEEDMRFIQKKVHIRKTVVIANHCSIKGTDVLVDFLHAFQKKYPQSHFEAVSGSGVYWGEEDLQETYVDEEELHDPEMKELLEIENLEEYVKGLDHEP